MTEPTKPNDNNKESGGELAHRQQQLVDMGSSTVSTGSVWVNMVRPMYSVGAVVASVGGTVVGTVGAVGATVR